MTSEKEERQSAPGLDGHGTPSLTPLGSELAFRSPSRQRQRTASGTRTIKETHNARSHHCNSQDDGTSQIRINQYLIGEEIGRGSYGAVHLAEDHTGKEFAVKEFSKSNLRKRARSEMLRHAHQRSNSSSPDLLRSHHESYSRPGSSTAATDNSFELIKLELAIMKKLNHPNVVALVEVLDDPNEDSLYMVLEMCKKGVIMQVHVDQSADPYDEEACRCWFRDLILGIEYLHHQGVIHRDIKPDNCLLTEDDTLKIVDFGVSEMFERQSEMKLAKSAGSPAFTAPELSVTKPRDVAGRPADIWSMGVTLYCLCFGRVPFRETSMLELCEAIIHKDPSIPSSCDRDLADLFHRILEKDPNKRITMQDLREHPWVTRKGTDPLLSTEENCAEAIQVPTDAEKNAAITDNIGGFASVIKAVNLFKALRKRPKIRQSIFGGPVETVQPPTTFTKSDVKGSLTSKQKKSGDEVGAHEAGDRKGGIERLDNESAAEKGKGKSSSKQYPDDNAPPQHAHRTFSEKGKGHAHDPLQDHLYLDIGPGPAADLDADDLSVPTVSESPSAAENDLYEQAFREEVTKIRDAQGHGATIYHNRWMGSSTDEKPSSKGLWGKAVGGTRGRPSAGGEGTG